MQITYQPGRTSLLDPSGQTVAFVSHPGLKPGIVQIDRLSILKESDRPTRKELLSFLMESALKHLQKNGLKGIVTCPAAQKWFQENPEYSDFFAQTVQVTPSY